MKEYDVIIIGGGPAGASAALYAARGGLSVCIIHNSASALEKATIQNYYGAGDVSGAELYKTGLKQASSVGAEVIEAQVTFASRGETDGFEVMTTAGKYNCKRLVIATGAKRQSLDIEGIKEYDGKGVSYCAVCDAFFCRNKRVAVIGAGEYAKHEYDELLKVAKEVRLLTNGEAVSFDASGMNVVDGKLSRVVGSDGRVCAVEFVGGEILELDALFVALGVMGSAAIAKSMGVMTDESGAIAVNESGMTNVDGLYAAGDCTAGIKQIARAVNDGMTVGLSLISDMKGKSEKR
ncbi:MAG: NAD(P)/FAD-dependent oxidoreductase [Clostridiales bacterium]|nr:NAD(P)/FAD-dependent oxidoreductase [Clostridiales bacterium]